MKRKLLTSLITLLISIPVVAYFFNDFILPAHLGLLGFVSIFLVPIVIFFGVPVSILSDKLTSRYTQAKRKYISITIHISSSLLFSYLFILIFDNRFVPSISSPIDRSLILGSAFTAFVFWSVSEYLSHKTKR